MLVLVLRSPAEKVLKTSMLRTISAFTPHRPVNRALTLPFIKLPALHRTVAVQVLVVPVVLQLGVPTNSIPFAVLEVGVPKPSQITSQLGSDKLEHEVVDQLMDTETVALQVPEPQ
jgi:hypothetical protein